MGAHTSARRNGRVFSIAGRGALTASAAIALIGGGAGVAFAGDAPDSSSSDNGHDSWGHDDKGDHDKGGHDDWGHDKGDHDGWGHKHDKCEDHKWDKKEEAKGLLGGLDLLGGHEKKDDCYDHDMKWDGDHKSDKLESKKDGLKAPTETESGSESGSKSGSKSGNTFTPVN